MLSFSRQTANKSNVLCDVTKWVLECERAQRFGERGDRGNFNKTAAWFMRLFVESIIQFCLCNILSSIFEGGARMFLSNINFNIFHRVCCRCCYGGCLCVELIFIRVIAFTKLIFCQPYLSCYCFFLCFQVGLIHHQKLIWILCVSVCLVIGL